MSGFLGKAGEESMLYVPILAKPTMAGRERESTENGADVQEMLKKETYHVHRSLDMRIAETAASSLFHFATHTALHTLAPA